MAVHGDEAEIDRVAALVSAHPEVTHNYLRNACYNVWFTVITPDDESRKRLIETIVAETGCDDCLDLPSTALYKIRVDFSGRKAETAPAALDDEATGFDPDDPFDVELVRWAQGDVSVEDPYGEAAAKMTDRLGRRVTSEQVIERIREWKALGVVRRFGAMVKHQNMGYAFNGMTAWDIEPGRLDEIGAAFAATSFVSHCYARPRHDSWPYNFYAMVHGKTQQELDDQVAALSALAGATPKVLVSTKEFKKASPVYFE